MILKLRSLVMITCLAASGCASIVSKSDKPVTITSNPPGASFVVKKASGLSVSNGVTPSTLILNSSDGYFKPAKYTIEFTRKNDVQKIPLTASINGWYFGNILFGGLIGLLIVDPATGAMWKLDETVIANFNHTAEINHHGKKLQVASIDQVPLELRGKLIAVR